MNIHPDILVHWTPKKWADKEINSELRQMYIEHLRGIYRDGLALNVPSGEPEIVRGWQCQTPIPSLPILCFTELRLSLVRDHMKKYGYMGIGFDRGYLMRRGANPVFYLQNADVGIANTNLKLLDGKGGGMNVFMSYMKPMSQKVNGELDNYDEMEWRFVACSYGNNPPLFPENRFKFEPKDVKMLVFPDEETRAMALKDETLRVYFEQYTPMMLDSKHIENI